MYLKTIVGIYMKKKYSHFQFMPLVQFQFSNTVMWKRFESSHWTKSDIETYGVSHILVTDTKNDLNNFAQTKLNPEYNFVQYITLIWYM